MLEDYGKQNTPLLIVNFGLSSNCSVKKKIFYKCKKIKKILVKLFLK